MLFPPPQVIFGLLLLSIAVVLISYGCIFKRSSKPVMKGSRVESIGEARNEYKKLLEEGRGKLIDSIG